MQDKIQRVNRIIITSGKYTDIDVLACAVSYKELLTKEGIKALVVLPGPFNKSITATVKKWDFKYEKTYKENSDDSYAIVDLSNPDYIPEFVDKSKIIEVYDHHFGYEKYWQDIFGPKAKIEKIGACATLIWEEYKKRAEPLSISTVSANLICTAIISNTLNFNASITSERDPVSFKELASFSKLPSNWVEKYFKEQEETLLKNPKKEMIDDTHVEKFPGLQETLIIGQIELWNSKEFVKNYRKEIKSAMESFKSPLWFFTSPSISEGKNYIYAENKEVQNMLEKNLKIDFVSNVATTGKLLLRKEIKKIIFNLA